MPGLSGIRGSHAAESGNYSGAGFLAPRYSQRQHRSERRGQNDLTKSPTAQLHLLICFYTLPCSCGKCRCWARTLRYPRAHTQYDSVRRRLVIAVSYHKVRSCSWRLHAGVATPSIFHHPIHPRAAGLANTSSCEPCSPVTPSTKRVPSLPACVPACLLELSSVELPQRASWCHVWQGSRIWHPVVGKRDEAFLTSSRAPSESGHSAGLEA
jgi:hypothetical protein